MKGSLALLALAGAAIASPLPQATDSSDCSADYDGEFTISNVNVTSSAKRSLHRRQTEGLLTLTLAGGILTDQAGRTGYIAANRQFQFDNPIQAGAVITSGFGVCSNGTLSLEGSAIWYQCLSGEFYNLYDESQGGQCNEIYLVVSPAEPEAGAATEAPDGQPQATSAAAPVTQIGDGQIQATSAPVTQIGDGQVQAPTGAPVTQIADGQIQAATGAPVTQIADGQIQAATGAPVTQIGDGQIQAPTATGAPVTQIGDGQVQAATSGAPVTQIGDGQVQAATSGAPVTQIGDGQVQAATSGAPVTQIGDGQVQAATSGAPVTQIGDGQVQAATSGSPVTQISDGQVQATTAAVATYTGAAHRELAGSFAVVAGIVGAVVML